MTADGIYKWAQPYIEWRVTLRSRLFGPWDNNHKSTPVLSHLSYSVTESILFSSKNNVGRQRTEEPFGIRRLEVSIRGGADIRHVACFIKKKDILNQSLKIH